MGFHTGPTSIENSMKVSLNIRKQDWRDGTGFWHLSDTQPTLIQFLALYVVSDTKVVIMENKINSKLCISLTVAPKQNNKIIETLIIK